MLDGASPVLNMIVESILECNKKVTLLNDRHSWLFAVPPPCVIATRLKLWVPFRSLESPSRNTLRQTWPLKKLGRLVICIIRLDEAPVVKYIRREDLRSRKRMAHQSTAAVSKNITQWTKIDSTVLHGAALSIHSNIVLKSKRMGAFQTIIIGSSRPQVSQFRSCSRGWESTPTHNRLRSWIKALK